MADYTLQLLTTNYSGQTANITFSPCSGGTINLGSQILPYDYVSEYVYGDYDLFFSAYNQTCSVSVPCPSPTPTVTQTITPTPTNTTTPTVTPTVTPSTTQPAGKPYTLMAVNGTPATGQLLLQTNSGVTNDPDAIFPDGTLAISSVDNLGTNNFLYFQNSVVNQFFRITLTQGSVTASYTGTTWAFQNQAGSPSLFFWGGGVGIRPGQMVLESGATGTFIAGQTVYVNAEALPDPPVTLLVYSSNKTLQDVNINGTAISLNGGSYPIARYVAGWASSHSAIPTSGLNLTIAGSGSLTLTVYKNGTIVDSLNNVTPAYPYTRNIFGQSWGINDTLKITVEG